MRRHFKWSASRITFELNDTGIEISRRTVPRIIRSLGLNRRRFIDPDGDSNRRPRPIVAKRPGHLVHVDVKKVGASPTAAGGAPTPAASSKLEQQHGTPEEFLNARTWTSEKQRSDAVAVWNAHYNCHRPHGAADDQPPASRAPIGVTNVMPYT